ncbi:hypothetical protein PVA19_08665 [Agrobacterium sp. CNPSo 3708]|uniref:hypothetical protein n=1 Tax=unclassified Agrobacterium TaxID=2632611 RepID=UPI0023631FBE|nr:hypothetical protein [Agrobacterium sp. CNPSo 3708]MDD1498484.1 hypothetical protein [Agrobacterium sp. CNPSo 3708]
MGKLPRDADLIFLVKHNLLFKPVDWLPAMYGNFIKAQKKYGPSCVRIGLSGKGHSPNYRIEPLNEPPKATPEEFEKALLYDGSHPQVDKMIARNTAFSGRSHKQPSTLQGSLDQENWSSAVNTEIEIKDLLQQVRRAPTI